MFTKTLARKPRHGTSRFWKTFIIFFCLFIAGTGLTYWASSLTKRNHLEHLLTKLLEGQLAWDSALSFFQSDPIPDPPKPTIINLPTEKMKEATPKENTAFTPKLATSSCSIPKEQYARTCKRQPAVSFKKQQIYQWRDAQGRTHFSDQAPQNGNNSGVKHRSLDSSERFTLNLDSHHASLPAFATDRIKRDVNTVYRVLVNDWAINNVQPIQLNLKLFNSKLAFNRYKDKVAPKLGTAGGFYIHRLREASVLYGNSDRMYSVTRHEATHAINHHAFGLMPTWLNEGLAEYFEGLSFQYGSHATNTPSKEHLHHLTHNPLPSLTDYLQRDGRAWYAEEQKSLNYAIAWSLVYFLLTTPKGETFFKGLLNNLSAHYCEGINTLQFVNQNYTGGVDQLSVDWRLFLRKKIPMHYY